MCKSPEQTILLFFLTIEKLSKYCSKATATRNSGLPAYILAYIHTGFLLTLQRAGCVFVEVMKLSGMCYIYYLKQTLERNRGKKRMGWNVWSTGYAKALPFFCAPRIIGTYFSKANQFLFNKMINTVCAG